MIKNNRYTLCVFGNPIAHSLSPTIHQQFAKQFNLQLEYHKIQPELDKFNQAVEQFKQAGGYGSNVTIPFKTQAFELADRASKSTVQAKAANTLTFHNDGTISADNTDGIGLIHDIKKNLGLSLSNKAILILGAGGAVRGILQPLLNQQPSQLTIANRTLHKAEILAQEYNGNITACSYQALNQQQFDVVIDSTGFMPQSLPLPNSLSIASCGLWYDLKYLTKPSATVLWAQNKGIKHIHNGMGMLVEQAAESFYIWTGKRPSTAAVIKQLRGQA